MGGIGLPGGAVYIETWRIRNRYWLSGMSLAGPAANGIFAIFLSILLRVLPASTSNIWPGISFLIVLQIWAILFNLIPLPGLDGYGVIGPFLNPAIQMQMERIRAYAFWILIIAFWYIPFVGNFFWGIVQLFATILFRVNLNLAAQGQYYLQHFIKSLLG
jgi:Zn-dependent protease